MMLCNLTLMYLFVNIIVLSICMYIESCLVAMYSECRGSSATKYACYKSKNAENTPSANARRRQLVVSVCATHSFSYKYQYTAAMCKAVVHKVNMHRCEIKYDRWTFRCCEMVLTLLLRYATSACYK